MKRLMIICLTGLCIYSGLAFKTKKEKFIAGASLYGIWAEESAAVDTAGMTRISFYPGGGITVLRKLHNYMGYFKIRNQQANELNGQITIGERFPFTATFITPDELRLTVTYGDHAEVHYLKKIGTVRSGFQLIGAEKKT